MALNTKRSGRKKAVAKHTENDQPRRQGANEERLVSWKASEESMSRWREGLLTTNATDGFVSVSILTKSLVPGRGANEDGLRAQAGHLLQ